MPTAFLGFSGGDGLVEVAGAIGVLITMGVLVRGVDDRGAANQTGTIRWQLVALAGVCFGLTTLTSPGGTLAVVIGVSALVGNMIIRRCSLRLLCLMFNGGSPSNCGRYLLGALLP